MPARYRGEALPLGRYCPIVVETDAERDEVMHVFDPVGRGSQIDLLDHQASCVWSDRVLISRYDPPAEGWPWVSVTRWEEAFRGVCVEHGIAMVRGCFTMELFACAAELDDHCAALLKGLGSQ